MLISCVATLGRAAVWGVILVARLALLVSCRAPKIIARVRMASSCWSPMDGKGVAGCGTVKDFNRLRAACLTAST